MFGLAMFFFSLFVCLALKDIQHTILETPVENAESVLIIFLTLVIGGFSELGLRKAVKTYK